MLGPFDPSIVALAVLAPALALLLGLAGLGGMVALGSGPRVTIWWGRATLALALGLALRLLRAYGSPSQIVDVFPLMGLAPARPELVALVDVERMDWLAAGGMVAILSIALGVLARPAAPSIGPIAGLLLAGLAAVGAVISVDLIALASLWVILALGGAVAAGAADPAAREIRRDWGVIALAGSSALWGAAAAMTASADRLGESPVPSGVSALLLLTAASAAGLGPLAGLTRGLGRAEAGRYAVRAALRIVGFVLAARVVAWSAADPAPQLRGLLIGLALWGIVAAVFSGGTANAFGQILTGLAFLGLAAASVEATLVGLALVASGAAADTLAPGLEAALHARLSGKSARSRPRRGSGAGWRTGWAEGPALIGAMEALAGSFSDLAREIENRYDLAVGLLAVLVVVLAFAR